MTGYSRLQPRLGVLSLGFIPCCRLPASHDWFVQLLTEHLVPAKKQSAQRHSTPTAFLACSIVCLWPNPFIAPCFHFLDCEAPPVTTSASQNCHGSQTYPFMGEEQHTSSFPQILAVVVGAAGHHLIQIHLFSFWVWKTVHFRIVLDSQKNSKTREGVVCLSHHFSTCTGFWVSVVRLLHTV